MADIKLTARQAQLTALTHCFKGSWLVVYDVDGRVLQNGLLTVEMREDVIVLRQTDVFLNYVAGIPTYYVVKNDEGLLLRDRVEPGSEIDKAIRANEPVVLTIRVGDG